MENKRRFHRFTISITKDLKSRMDDVQGPNWSAVARAAFERELAETARRVEHHATDFVCGKCGALNPDEFSRPLGPPWESFCICFCGQITVVTVLAQEVEAVPSRLYPAQDLS